MAGGDEVIHQSSDFGKIASHPVRDVQPFLVAPTTDTLFNTLGLDLIPVACMSLHDILFAFDSSFVTQSVTVMLTELPGLRESHKNTKGELPRLSIFGHADPVGDDELNKQLSGRRATAIYGVLTQSVPIWRKLLNHSSPFGDDNWRTQNVTARMRAVVGSSHNSDDDLIKAYLAAICPFQLTNADFLGNGGDPDGKADFQGCSSFNAQVILSEKQDNSETKEDRNKLNQPNRRVVVFFFRAGTTVNPSMWPCPTAGQTTGKCRDRFFGPPTTGDDRRKPDGFFPRLHLPTPTTQADLQDDTFACRFYARIAQLSPCEGKIVPALRTLHVFLKLRYKDPEDPAKPHDFPPGVPVIVDDGGGTVLTVNTVEGGLVDFEYDRDRHKFTLRFELGDGQYFANATPATKGPGPERLLKEAELPDAVKDNYRFFKVPPKWSLAETDWTVGPSTFSQNFFLKLDADGAIVGSLGSPVAMLLDPHWQYLRFVYFDRALKKKFSILPITLDGFRKATGTGSPDTRSNWTVKPDALVQCLPWIPRTPPKPDKDTLLQFQTGDNTFLEANEDNGSRTVASGTKHEKPEADRLRFYDLPKLWKSSHYFARFSDASGVDANKDGPYEKVADKPTTLALPMVFSLDDMVLTDASIHPIAWTAKDRVAIFKHSFADQGDEIDIDVNEIGLFQPSTDTTESYLSQPPRIDTGGNYIAEYPDWTRLLVVKANLFDVFDRRTASGPVIGARAAVRWVEAASRGPAGTTHPASKLEDGGFFFTIQSYFEQSHHADLVADNRIGRFDMALLRCCDKEDDVEVAANFNYFPYHFNFHPIPDPNIVSTPLQPPLSNDKVEQQKWSDLAVRTLARRWNGIHEPLGSFGPGRPQLLPDEDDPTTQATAPDLRADMVFFAQSLPRGLAHLSWNVFKDVRAFAGSRDGIGSVAEPDGEPVSVGQGRMGAFVVAHETGHIYSLGDEYIETQAFASNGQSGIASYSPGSAYAMTRPDMMIANFDLSPRYFWHAAEWVHALKPISFPFFIKQGKFEYRLPHHPDLPLRSFVNHSIAEKRDASVGAGGRFDIFLFAFGDEPFNVDRLPAFLKTFAPPRISAGKFDAVVSVVMKFKIHAFKNDDKLIDAVCNGINGCIVTHFDNLWSVKGSAQRKFFTGDGTYSFKNAYVIFEPRFLVQNFPNDKNLRKAMRVTSDEEYQSLVQSLENTLHVSVEVRSQEKGVSRWDVKPAAPAAGKTAPRGRLIVSHEDLKSQDTFGLACRAFLWNVLGFNDATTAAGTQQLQQMIRQVSPDATVAEFGSAPNP